MQEVQIGDKILFNRNGMSDELELWEVVDGGVTYPSLKQIGVDLLFTIQDSNGKTFLQCGIEDGYIRLVEKVEAARPSAQQNLADHIQKMQNALTMDCMKYWRTAGENCLTAEEAAKVLHTLEEVGKTLKYAKNCCHWVINGWEHDGEGNIKKPDNATSN